MAICLSLSGEHDGVGQPSTRLGWHGALNGAHEEERLPPPPFPWLYFGAWMSSPRANDRPFPGARESTLPPVCSRLGPKLMATGNPEGSSASGPPVGYMTLKVPHVISGEKGHEVPFMRKQSPGTPTGPCPMSGQWLPRLRGLAMCLKPPPCPLFCCPHPRGSHRGPQLILEAQQPSSP